MNPYGMFGLEVHVSSVLAGGKKAVRQGGRLYVSPAMYDLISHAHDHTELEVLLGRIEVVEIPEMPSIFGPLPITTKPPEFKPGWDWRKAVGR